jgi:DNA end-binding protein Ku
VGLHTASTEQGVDFDWLDKRSMDRVGYKRINKRTGKEIAAENIVKGVEYEDGKYVVVSREEIEAAYPRTTQTIEIQRFIEANEIPFLYLERPYYVAPVNKGHKVYALLREVMVKTGKIGLAKVVIATKQHLAALVPAGEVLVLNLLRWGDEVKPVEGLDLPPAGVKGARITPAEMKMAEQLVKDMSGKWKPEEFKDEFKHAVMKVVEKKVKAGDTETVIEPEEEAPSQGAEVIDLTELLTRSLRGGKAAKASGAAPAKKTAASKKKTGASAKKAADKKAPASRRKAA